MAQSLAIYLFVLSTVLLAGEPVKIVLDDSGPGKIFQGIGAASGGGGVSRLLINYPEPQRSQILDYLFKPNFGASLQLLKIEIGGDGNSTEGSEPSHMHHPGDQNYSRGFEWWIAAEAKKRNPSIKLIALAWDYPAWIKNVNSQAAADYLIAFLEGNKRDHSLEFDYVGIWNETKTSYDFIKRLKRTLDAHHLKVKIMADDLVNTWAIADEMRKDADLRDAVAVVNTHYPKFNSTEAARNSGKPIWSGEDGSWSDIWGAGHDQSGPYAEVLNRNYVLGRMTSTILWCLITSYYDILDVPYAGLVRAATPWSGHYEVMTPLWIVAHTTQFARPGWRYLDGASGRLSQGGSYVTLKNGSDYSVIIETVYGIDPVHFEFAVRGGLSTSKVRVWRTNRASAFERMQDLTPLQGRYRFDAEPDSVYTLTTTTGQRKGGNLTPPPDKPFPVPYREDFENYSIGNTTPDYFIEQNGSYEVAACAGGRPGKCLRQVVTQSPIVWTSGATAYLLGTAALIGDKNWGNYEVGADVLLEEPGYARVMGRVSRVTLDGQIAGYQLYLHDTGKWELCTATRNAIMASGTVPFLLKTWHRIKLAFRGDRINVAIDGLNVADLRDTHFSNGMAGLGNDYNLGQYDNFEVRPIAGVPLFATPPASDITTVPDAPQLMPPVPLNQGVLLAWLRANGAKGYKLRIGAEKGKYGTTIDAGALTSYRAWTLTNSKTYYFVVLAYNEKGESKPSNEVSATPSRQ